MKLFKDFITKIHKLYNKVLMTHFAYKLKYLRNKVTSPYKNYIYSKEVIIKREDGFKKINFKNNRILKEAIKFSKKNFDFSYIEKMSNVKKKDEFLSRCDLNVLKYKPLTDLVTEKKVINIVSNYLQSLPILLSASVWLTKFSDKKPDSSQLYHFDREDSYQLKVFIPLEPIKETAGPLCLLSAKQSSEFIRNNLKRFKLISLKDRIDDSEVLKNIKDPLEYKQVANPGELIFADTTNCLHYGSRFSKTLKYHLSLQYVSPFSVKLSKFLTFVKKNNLEKNKLDVLSYFQWKYNNPI